MFLPLSSVLNDGSIRNGPFSSALAVEKSIGYQLGSHYNERFKYYETELWEYRPNIHFGQSNTKAVRALVVGEICLLFTEIPRS